MNFSNLLHWAAVFFVIAIIAGVLGMGGIAGATLGGAKLLFMGAIILAVASAAIGLLRRG